MLAMPADQDASKCYDPTDDEYYYGYGCTIVSTGTTTCWPQGSCQSLHTTHETLTIRKTSSTGSKTASNTIARTFS